MADPASQGSTARRVLSDAARQIGAGLAGLLTYPVIARVVKDDGLGAWSILATISFVPLLTDLGLTTAVQRAAARLDEERTRRALSLALFFIFSLTPLVVVGLYPFFLDVGDATPELQADVARAAWLTLAGGTLAGYTAPYRGLIIVRGRVKLAANARLGASLTQVAIVATGIFLPPTLLVPAAGVFFGQLLECWMVVGAARALDRTLPLLPSWPRGKREILEDLREGAATLASNASNVAAVRVDTLVLSQVAPLSQVASYGVALRAVDQAYVISSKATLALVPRLRDPLLRVPSFRLGTLLYAGLVVSGMAALTLDGQPLLVAWVGPVAASVITARTALLLGTAAAVMSLQEVATQMLVISGRTAWQAAIPKAAGSIVNLTVSIAGAARFGMWAVAGSTLLGNLVHVALALRAAKGMLGWSLRILVAMLLPVVVCAGTAVGIGMLLAPLAKHGPLSSLACCLATLTAGAGVMLVMVARDVRAARIPPAPTAEPKTEEGVQSGNT